ncbi:hypothetical protein IMZ48_33830 [Candidatus Bathyarchaeota archaeon]|nr:hypothetical protein [Candidatus Bathyarchaeota archaeon]
MLGAGQPAEISTPRRQTSQPAHGNFAGFQAPPGLVLRCAPEHEDSALSGRGLDKCRAPLLL